MWRLDECDVSGQTIRLQAIPARMSCDEILVRVGEEVLKEYRNLHHTRGLRPGDRDVNYVGEGSGGQAAMNPAGADGNGTLVNDDDYDEPAEMAICAFVANNLNVGSNRGSWKPLPPGRKKKEKKDPRRIGNPPLSFGEFIRAHPQGCFVCYGRKQGFNHDHRTCAIHQADTEAYKKAQGSKKRAPAGIREAKVEVDKDLRGSGEGNLQASLGMQDPNPMKSKTSSCFLADLPSVWDSPKNSVILASAMTQYGVLGKEMKVYVDNINM